MERLRRLLAGSLIVVAATAADSAPGSIARSPEFVQKVNAAIDRGVAWVRTAQLPDGSYGEFPGYPYALDALAYHTFRASGVPRDDPAVARTWTSLSGDWRRNAKHHLKTYAAALFLLALYDHGEPDPAAGDGYVKLSAKDRECAEEIVKWLTITRAIGGGWAYFSGSTINSGSPRGEASCDLSNTQFALLGLRAASLCGIEIDPALWTKALEWLLIVQEKLEKRRPPKMSPRSGPSPAASFPARGWPYFFGFAPSGSMNAGGIASAVICRDELGGRKPWTADLAARTDEALRDAVAWTAATFDVRTNPGLPRGMPGKDDLDTYYLYSLERAGVLAGVEWFGAHDWYGEGVEFLCSAQAKDGAWRSKFVAPAIKQAFEVRRDAPASMQRQVDLIDTCFSLLFLKRDATPLIRPAGTLPNDALSFDRAGQIDGAEFADFLDLVLLRWRRATKDDVRAQLFDDATALGPPIVEPLLVRMDSTDPAVRAAAFALLRRATGLDFAFDPAADAAAREAAVVRWQTWWFGAKDRLRYDAASKRLVVSGG